ncbi:carboxypeptidase regulatory-like domain-containing protein [uncultured Cellulomonas sp.]|uniref:carboxypeptidase regulatory-like domain-containing protein n=1 Tax=uncultured Cellulomonas sp. TaxID=189682 RepID=UPI0028E57F46|nr:carboxypeptidase regulatory-like domain-containing protein [uncultured Cellulomonas sp.]
MRRTSTVKADRWAVGGRRLAAMVGLVALVVGGASLPASATTPGKGAIAGTVTVPVGESPSSVSVVAQSKNSAQWAYYSANAHEDGTFLLDDVTPGTYTVEFVPAGSSDLVGEFYDDAATSTLATIVTVAADQTLTADADLELGASIEGRVTDWTGEPVVGASVSVQRADYTGTFRSSSTDVNGDYHVGGLRPGDYRISVISPFGSMLVDGYYGGTSPSTAQIVPVAQRAQVQGKDVVLAQAAVVTGRMLHAGEPVPWATVAFTSAADGTSTTSSTGPDGLFTQKLRAGTYVVRFSPPSTGGMLTQYWQGASTEAAATPLVVVAGQTSALGDITMTDGGAIAGTVTDSAGAPVAGVNVWVSATGGSNVQATTGADGTYRASGLSPGEYRVRFQGAAGALVLEEYYDDARQYLDADLVTSSGSGTVSGIDARLESGSGVTGRVLDADGNPVVNASVWASPRFTLSGSWSSAFTDAEGSYSLGGLVPGDWSFRVQAPPGSPWAGEWYLDAGGLSDAETVPLVAGERTELEDVRLERGVTLSGRVLGPDGSPVAGANVAPISDGGLLLSATTALDGTYTLRGLRPGAYPLYVSAPLTGDLLSGYYPDGGVPTTPQKLTLTTEPVQQAPDIRLQRGATVSGTITRSDGTPVRNAGVWVELVSPTGYGASGSTDELGNYRVTGVRGGDVTVQASATDGEEWGADYSGVSTYYAPPTGTPRRSQATVLHPTAGGSLSDIDIALPPRGSATADVTMSLSPTSPAIGRPATVTAAFSGASGVPTGVVDFFGDGWRGDVVLNAQGRASFTFTPTAETQDFELHAIYSGNATYDEVWGNLVYLPGEPSPAPNITAVSPPTVSALGGTQVTLTGTGFDPDASVTFGGLLAADVVVESATSLRATAPPHAAGVVPVVVSTGSGGPSVAATLTYAPEPTTLALTSSAPSVGPGQAVTFTATVTSAAGAPTGPVQFAVDGGTPVSVSTVAGVATYSATGLAAGSHQVTASFPGDGTYAPSSATLTQTVLGPGPTVSGVSPAIVTTDGAVRVTVTGTSLAGATAVTFGDTPGTGLQAVSATQVSVLAPAHAAGAVPVRVTTASGTSTTSASFLYVDASDGVVSQTPQRAVSDPAVDQGRPICVQITGTHGVPVGASGVILNVTTVHPSALGHVVVYPDTDGTGTTAPPSGSTVNFEPGADVANAAFVQLPANGAVCYYTRSAGPVGVLLDVTGFTMPDAGIVTQASRRLVDTRPGAQNVGTITGPVAPHAVQTVQVSGVAGVPADASAVILNATITGARAPGNLRVFPAGQAVPNASVVNYAAGTDKANATIVDLPASGKVSFYSDTGTPVNASPVNVILDVTGYVVGDTTYSAVTPTRVLDTRPGSNHLGPMAGALSARTVYQVRLPGSGGVPAGASAVVLNVTAIGPTGLGNLRVYPNAAGSGAPPTASTLNYVPGRDVPNLVVVAIPDDGLVNLYSDMAPGGLVHVAADVVGYVHPGE